MSQVIQQNPKTNQTIKTKSSATNKRRVDGVLLLDKPSGITSNGALQKVKRLFAARKAGHTGSLDPIATGMLPICFGQATKFAQYLLGSDKTYLVSAKLGERTNTSDIEGEIISKRSVPSLTLAKLNDAFEQFRGEIDQVPSMFSAIKHKGQPLYKLARQGITVPRESRRLKIYFLNVLNYANNIVEFEVKCSKGTYVRTLVDDFGEILGCGAHVIKLRRLQVAAFKSEQMIDLETLEKQLQANGFSELDKQLLPVNALASAFPSIRLTPSMVFYMKRGEAIYFPRGPTSGFVQLYDEGDKFIGLGEVLESGKIAPRRLLA